jgi:hypothetical protein
MEFKHEKDTQDVLERCQVFINEFHKTDLYPVRLNEIEKKLASYYAFLVRKKAHAQAMQNTHYWIRKISHSRESIKARGAGAKSQGEASDTGLTKIQKEIDEETYSVWRYEDLNGFCRALDKVFVSIAHQLKDYEKERIIQRKQQS